MNIGDLPLSPLQTAVLTAFIYKDELYLRAVPVKSLFNSNMIHQVTTRGDIFAVRVKDQALTIVPGTAQVTHTKAVVQWKQPVPEQARLDGI